MRFALALSFLFAGLVVADRITKLLMMGRPLTSGPFLFPGVFEFTQHRNFGILANIPIPLWLILAVSACVLAAIAVGFTRAARRREVREAAALTLILAGAVGNIWDRIQWHFVFDWILLFGQSAINLADVWIGAGLVWYLLDRERDMKKRPPLAKGRCGGV